MKIYLLRHGETHFTKNHLEYGSEQYTAEILPEAKPTTKKMGEYLKDVKSDHSARSEFLRVKQTTDIITQVSGIEFAPDDRLNEIMWERDKAANLYDKPESTADLSVRVRDFLAEMESKNYKTIVVATHGGVIACVKNLIIKDDFQDADISDFPPPGVLTIMDGKDVEEIDFRD